MENEEDSLGLFLLNDCLNLDSSSFNSRYHHVNEQKKNIISIRKKILYLASILNFVMFIVSYSMINYPIYEHV